MKLSRVKLAFSLLVSGTVMEQAQSDINEDHISQDGTKPGWMRFDTETYSLEFWTGQRVNWSQVIEWWPLNIELVCDKCDATFKNAQALGGHRRFCEKSKELK